MIQNIKALFLYALLISILYGPVVFGGRSLLPPLYQPNGVLETGAYGYYGRTPVNSFNVDLATPAYYEFPINRLTGDLYRNFELPLWNPYQASGTPLAAQYSTRVFFPYQILEDLSPVEVWDFFILGRLLIGGFFAYLFLKAIGLSFPSSLLGGIFYMFSGTFVWFINLEQMANPAMMAPVVMWTMERLARVHESGRRVEREIVFSSFAFFLLHLAGQPEVALYATLLAFSFFIFRVLSLYRGRLLLTQVLSFSFSYLIGLGLASFLIIPFIELVNNSHHIHPPGWIMGLQAITNWKSIFSVLVPGATEFAAHPEMTAGLCGLVESGGSFYRFLPVNGVWDSIGGYTGTLAIALSAIGVFAVLAEEKKTLLGPIYFFILYGASIILKNLGVEPFIWMGGLPLFDQVWSLRWAGPSWTFAFSAAGAIGLESLIKVTKVTEHGSTDRLKSGPGLYFRKKPYMAITSALLIVLGLFILFPLFDAVMLKFQRKTLFGEQMSAFVMPSVLSSTLAALIVLVFAFAMAYHYIMSGKGIYGFIALGAAELWWAVPRGYEPDFLALRWIPFIIGLLTSYLFYREDWFKASLALSIFFISALLLDLISPRGFPDRKDPFRAPPYVEFLKDRAGFSRTVAGYGVMFPNFSGVYGVPDVRYVNSLVPSSYHDYRKSSLQKEPLNEEPVSSLWFTGRPERCVVDERSGKRFSYGSVSMPFEDDLTARVKSYSLLGVRYMMLPKERRLPEKIPGSSFPLVYDKEVRIYENPLALDRVFMAYDYEYASTPEEARRAASREGFDIAKKIVLESKRNLFPDPEGAVFKARIKEYSANRVTVDVASDRDGVLVLSDVFYPGWKVYVNGDREELLRVNGVVKGVFVGKGKSEVVFRYMPGSFLAGLAISSASFMVCGFLLTKGWEKEKK